MSNYFGDVFKELSSLTEDVIDLDDDGVQELQDMENSEDTEEDVIDIIDPNAESEEDLSQSYVDKIILECPVCHSFSFAARDDVDIDASTELANVSEECPYCCEVHGFNVIGQVAPFDESEEDEETEEDSESEDTEEVEPEDTEDDGSENEDEEEEVEDDSDMEESLNENHKCCHEDSCDDECDISDDDVRCLLNKKFGANGWSDCEYCNESLPATIKVSNNGKFLGEFYCVDSALVEGVTVTANDDETIITQDDSDTTVTVSKNGGSAEIGDVDLEPDGTEDDITVETSDNKETVVPLSDEEQEEIENDTEENTEEDQVEENMNRVVNRRFDDFDEDAFNALSEKYLRRTYENVRSFEVNNVSATDSAIIVEGVITFKSGRTKNSKFKFEAKDITPAGKARFIGENLSLSTARKAFTVTGSLKGGKFISESLNYNYSAKTPDGKSSRVYGTVKNR